MDAGVQGHKATTPLLNRRHVIDDRLAGHIQEGVKESKYSEIYSGRSID
jgi:hypothetical protein